MKKIYRTLLVVGICTTAFFVSGKKRLFTLAEESTHTGSAQTQTAETQKRPNAKNKPVASDSLPVAALRTLGALSLSALKEVDKSTAIAGDTLTYKVTITNSGSDTAWGLTFTDKVDANTTVIPDSLWYSPIAMNDFFTCIGNVGISVPAVSGVLANDQEGSPAAALQPFTRTTAKGGTITLNADGSFDYTPAAGFSGLDTIQYILTNRVGTDLGVIHIDIPAVIWFVNNNSAVATADGRLASPFRSIADFQSVNTGAGNNPKGGHAIFLYESNTAYNGNITLLNGQKLIGQDATTNLAAIAGITLPPYSRALPALDGSNSIKVNLTTTTANTNSITLASAGTGYLVRGVSIGDKTGKGIAGNNFGTLTLTETAISGTGQALDLTNGTVANASGSTTNLSVLSSSSGTYGVYLNGVSGALAVATGSSSISGSTITGFFVSGGTATITYPGHITGMRPVDIQSTNGSTLSFTGNIASTNLGINLANNTNSTITFSGASKSLNTGANQAVSIINNTGSTIAFTNGGLVINTTTANGFHASGATGALTVTGTGNLITVAGTAAYNGGIALNVSNATIGAGGLVFQSVNSNNAQKGIVLNSTGTTAGLTITGTGTTAGSGGTLQNTASRGIEISNAQNISLSNINLPNANQTNGGTCTELDNAGCNAAVYISNTSAVTLNKLLISGARQQGINLNSVTDLTMDGCTVNNSGDEAEEGALKVRNLLGTCTIQNSSFTNSKYRNAHLVNTTGVLTLRVSNSDFAYTTATTAGDLRQDCFEMRTKNNATATVIISGSQFRRAGTKGIQLFAENNSTMNAAITNCTVDRHGGQMAGIEVGSNHSGIMRANIDGNPVVNATNEIAVNVYAGGTAASSTSATVRNNSGISGFGNVNNYTDPTVQAFTNEQAKGVVLISGNTIANSDGQAILSRASEGSGTMDATFENNTVTIPANGFNGIEVISGADLTPFTNKVCAHVHANSVINNGTEGGLAFFAQAVTPGTTLQLQQKPGTNGGADLSDASLLWANNGNTGGPVEVYKESDAILQVGLQHVCQTPSNLVAPTVAPPVGGGDAIAAVEASIPATQMPEEEIPVASSTDAPLPAAITKLANTLSEETITISGLNLPDGKSQVVMFKVRVNAPFPANVCAVSNQAEISGNDIPSFQTNTAVTAIHAAPVITACQADITATTSTCESVQSLAITATGCPAPTYRYILEATGAEITSPYAFPVGVTTVKAIATNVAGEVNCTFTVTINGSNATWTGTVSADWHTAANWSCGKVPDLSTNVTINPGAPHMPVLTGNGGVKNLTMGAGTSLSITAGFDFEITGDFSGSGTIASAGTVRLSSYDQQHIPAGTYYNLVISNGSNKVLAGDITINGELHMLDGYVILQHHSLFLAAAAYITDAGASSFVVTNGSGLLRKEGLGATGLNTPFIFPVGSSVGSYTPATITNNGTLDNYSVRVIEHVYNGYAGTTPEGSPISSTVVDKTWFVNEDISGGSDVTLTLQWNKDEELPGFMRTNSYVAHNTGTAWLEGRAANADAGSEADSYIRTWAGLTSFSPFGVGSSGSALPVQLLSFRGLADGESNKLEWTVAAEQMLSYKIERSERGGNFVQIGEVAAGFSAYRWKDEKPLQGVNNYRLRMVHPGGKTTYSAIITITRGTGAASVNVYPNPVVNGQLNIQCINLPLGNYAVSLHNYSGQAVYTTTLRYGGGSVVAAVQLPETISKGLYILQVKKGDKLYTSNLIIQ